MKGLGRFPQFDIRSRGYSVSTLLGDFPPVFTRIWSCEAWLDQGVEGACVGFSWAHDIAAEPVVSPVDEPYAQMIYREAKKVDEWEGEDYDGTSVLAGAKVMKSLGWIDEYRWAFSTDDALATISNLGPVILGINWYEGMFDTDISGFIAPTGRVAGGHAILAIGYDSDNDAVLLHNSWGDSWGINGRAWLKVEDLDRLLRESGEVCVPLIRSNPIIDPTPIEPDPEPSDPEPSEPEPWGCLGWFIPRSLRKRISNLGI